jgi:hypothetical protein
MMVMDINWVREIDVHGTGVGVTLRWWFCMHVVLR